MKMLVLGAGLQGSACAYDLLQNPDVTEVRLADLHAESSAAFPRAVLGQAPDPDATRRSRRRSGAAR